MGIFTGRDAVCRVMAEGKDAAAGEVSDAMTANPVTISPDASPVEALRLMWDGGFRHLPLVKNGKLRVYASSGRERSQATPDLPTVAESGVAGFEMTPWFGLGAPNGVPRAIVERSTSSPSGTFLV